MKYFVRTSWMLLFALVCVLLVLAKQQPLHSQISAPELPNRQPRLLDVQYGPQTPQPPAVKVTVHPKNAPVTSSVTQSFTAMVTGTSNTAVTWYVDGIQGGSAVVGTVDANGLYTPPSSFVVGRHMVKAISQADDSKFAQGSVYLVSYAGTFTSRNDNQRTGQNLGETALTQANVNTATFGKVFSFTIDGGVHAQTLYVPNVNVPNPLNGAPGFHNVVYVATEHDSVFAFDADGKVKGPLWKTVFINPPSVVTVPGSCFHAAVPEFGITATPVIDSATNTLYVEARTLENPTDQCTGTFVHKLHALDITTGLEKFGGPVIIKASVPGTGAGSINGMVPFNPERENVRAGLLLSKTPADENKIVYLGAASVLDLFPFHGWVLGYDSQTLEMKYVFNTTPNGAQGGIWQLGAGLAADTQGNIFAQTGNGTFVGNKSNYAQTVLKLAPRNGSLKLLDYFTPGNWKVLNSHDWDISSGGLMLLPKQPGDHPLLMVGGGKEGTIYVMDRNHLGKYKTTGDDIVQEIVGAIRPSVPGGEYYGMWGTAGYFNHNVYIFGRGDYPKMFTLNNGLLPSTATSMGTTQMKAPVTAFSAKGATNGLVWILEYDARKLSAFDPQDLTHEFYDSNQNPQRDQINSTIDAVSPTVANGRVYVPTTTSLMVYGLLE